MAVDKSFVDDKHQHHVPELETAFRVLQPSGELSCSFDQVISSMHRAGFNDISAAEYREFMRDMTDSDSLEIGFFASSVASLPDAAKMKAENEQLWKIFCDASGDDVPKYLTSTDLVRVAKTLGMTMTKQRAADIIRECGGDERISRAAFLKLLMN